jgi:hypothetical protein
MDYLSLKGPHEKVGQEAPLIPSPSTTRKHIHIINNDEDLLKKDKYIVSSSSCPNRLA